jgi:hypothetical protein
MSAGIGSGKSWTVAFLAIFHLLQGKRVLMIAPTGSMIRDVLILQMKEILDSYNIPAKLKTGQQLLRLGEGILFLRTEHSKHTINGLTKINTTIIDECRFVSELACAYAESRMRGIEDAKLYLTGTGASKHTWFAKKCLNPENTWINVPYTANIRFNGQEYIDRMTALYADLPKEFRDRELYGLHTDNDEFSLFYDVKIDVPEQPGKITAGLDIAGTGADYSACAIFNGNKLIFLGKKKTQNELELKFWQKELTNQYVVEQWFHDATGIGNLWQFPNSIPVNFGASGGNRFANKRARIYFDLKEKLQTGICFANAEIKRLFTTEVMQELTLTKLSDKDKAKLTIDPKDEIRKALGRSPDLSDALALASAPAYDSFDANAFRYQQVKNNPFRRPQIGETI